MTPEQEAMLRATHEAVQAIQQLLKGYSIDNKSGLIAEFTEHRIVDEKFRREFYDFRTRVYILIAFAAGGGGAVGAGLSRWFGG